MRQAAKTYSVVPNLEGHFVKEPLSIKSKKSDSTLLFWFFLKIFFIALKELQYLP